MAWKYTKYIDTNNIGHEVEKVSFNRGRYGVLAHTITFSVPMTPSQAIKEAEQWLNAPLSQTELQELKANDDVFDEKEADSFKYRWQALGDCTILENAVYDTPTEIYLLCGS